MKKVFSIFVFMLMCCSLFVLFSSAAESSIISLYDDKLDVSERTAEQLNDNSWGTKFTVPEGKELINFTYIQLPTWGAGTGVTCQFNIYLWDTDYATTVAKTPLIPQQTLTYGDNDKREIVFSEPLKAGNYLVVLSDAQGKNGGIFTTWCYPEKDGDLFETYIDGEEAEYNGMTEIIVRDAASQNPKTGDMNTTGFYMLVAAVLILTVWIKHRSVA